MTIAEQYRYKIHNMDFIRLTEEEVLELRGKYKDAVTNNEMEGLYLTKEQEDFFEMLFEEKVPTNISDNFIDELIAE